VGLSNLQDDLKASGYSGLINLNIVRGTMYTGTPSTGCKVPALYPCGTGLTNLAAVAGGTGELPWNNAVILSTNGNFREKLYIYYGSALDFRMADDVALIRQKLINWAHADGLYPPIAAVKYPNGGEYLSLNQTVTFQWGDAGAGGNAQLDLYKGGAYYSTIIASTTNNGSYAWTIPAGHLLGNDFKLKVTPFNAPEKADMSDNNFTIGDPVYTANMDSNPGWTLSGEWEYGAIGSMSETCYVPPSPPSGAYSGSSVIGYDLNGSYATGMVSTMWATTQVIDCTYRTNVTLSYMRYLGVYNNDKAYVQAKNGTGSWQTVYQSTTWESTESWVLITNNISAIADGKSGVQVRFGIGPTASAYPMCGFYIDDMRVLGSHKTTASGTRYSWLASYGITNNQEAADLQDTDGDGALNWEEYLAGTNPTNANSTFSILSSTFMLTSNSISWYATTNSGITSGIIIQRATNLTGGLWIPVGTNSRSQSGTNVWWDRNPPVGVPLFYRLAIP
jgi:hypothetical protein